MAAADIKFKRGTQAALNLLKTEEQIEDGCIYITTDSQRLAMGLNNELVYIGDGIRKVATIGQLPTDKYGDSEYGGFWYVENGNVLCVKSSTTGQWIQINGGNDEPGIKSYTLETSLVDDTHAQAKYTIELADESTLNVTLELIGDNGLKFEADADGHVTIKPPAYSIASARSSDGSGIDINLTNDSTVPTTKATLKFGQNFTIQTNGQIDVADMHVSEVTIEPTDGGFEITVTNEDGNSASAVLQPTFKLGAEGQTSVQFGTDGSITLPAYTKQEIDTKLGNLNAMTFRGTVGTGGTVASLPTTQVQAGDTYLAKTAGTYAGQVSRAGDLFIAYGDEGADGFLTTVSWAYVPSGDDAELIIRGVFHSEENKLEILETNTSETLAVLQFTAGTAITIATEEMENGKGMNTTISHANVPHTTTTGKGINQSEGADLDVPIITKLSVNDQGHVTGIETTTYKLHDSNIVGLEINTGVNGSGGAKVTVNQSTVATKKEGGSVTGSTTFDVTSDNECLKVNAPNTRTVQLDLVWGEF